MTVGDTRVTSGEGDALSLRAHPPSHLRHSVLRIAVLVH